ncbi:hypothetical protein Ddye_006386 [Dipteronia dyeriana]|uniref:DUF1985 domain-containing protein n=1 Tax=Dipteronia dyeriana TaxID=168575 RepID=A0AAD9XID7_9ROSI|nr:hypothetical protein Ddye_006386 [Dipteronia dyeriana]
MLGRWEQCVFKWFLGMNNELFSGKLCDILLCRELHFPGACPEEMWFRVKNRAVRFGKVEFLLVTGLRFRLMPESVNSLPKVAPGNVHHLYFGGSPTPLNHILGILSREEFGEAEDDIQLGYVYFLSHILLGREYRWFVHNWLWGLVEDITGFEAFPWGTYIARPSRFYLFGWKAEKWENGPGIPPIDKVESLMRSDNLGDLNDAHEVGDDQHDTHEDEVGDDQNDEVADEVHDAQEDEVGDDQHDAQHDEVTEGLHGKQEAEVDEVTAEQDAPQQGEVNKYGQV